jgi:uncharacterized protein (TIGR00369 family)
LASTDSIPPGFERLPQGLGFTDSLQPVYRRISGDRVFFGLYIAAHHSNSLGICHGGVLMSLADIAAASGVNLVLGRLSGNPTINLAVDFVNAARQGEWIEARPEHVNVKRRFGFCSGAIYAGERMIARFNGTFYLPDHDGMRQPGATGETALSAMNS